MKKYIAVLMSLTLLIGLFSSCVTAAQEPVVLNVTWWGSQGRHDYTQRLLDMYTSLNPHVTFQPMPSGWDGYFNKLSSDAASGTMPDIIQMDYLYIATYARNNTLADLRPFVDSGVIDMTNVDRNLYSTGYVDDKLAGITLSSSIFCFAYNPDVLADAGLAEPTPDWTWPDFEDMCLQVKEKTGKYGLSANVIDTNILNYWVRQYNSPLFSEDGKSLGYSDDSIFTEFAALQKRLVDAGAMPNPDQWLRINSLGIENGPVITGDGALTWQWNNYGVIATENNPNVKLMTPPYAGNGNKALWIKPGMFFSVAQTSRNQEEAAKFVNWFINDPDANDIINAERGVPVSSAIRDHLSPSLTKQQQDMFVYMDLSLLHASEVSPPEPQGISEINTLLVELCNRVLYDDITPEQAASEFRRQANEILARNN